MSNIWQKNLDKLFQFKAEHGHINVPKGYPDQQLARLVTTLRQQKRYGTLKAERELALHQLGFDFDPLQTLWLNNYQKIIEFYRMNGHTSPNRRSDNEHERSLADWVHRMHKLCRSNELSKDKKHKLKLINIDGDPASYRLSRLGLPRVFEAMLEKLTNHIKQQGPVINRNTTDSDLFDWLHFQQQRINSALITPKEYSALMNSVFTIKQQTDESSDEIKKYA